MIDSHCHLDCIGGADQPARIEELLERAAAHGVHGMLCISITLGNEAPRQLAAAYDPVWATVGVHPCHAEESPDVSVDRLCQLATAPKVIALGETGLDGYHQPVNDLQRASFIAHLQAGNALGLPVVVHTREAREETIALIAQYGSATQTGVLHCFTETWEMAKAALDLGYYISMSGIVSFPKATNVHEVCRKIPTDRLLIETDAPWLAPVPYRGKSNEPAFVSHVADAVARVRGTHADAIAEQTTENFERLFGVGRA